MLPVAGDLPDRPVRAPRGIPTYDAIRTRRYRYDLQDDGAHGLYDLKRDPWELEGVAGDPRYERIEAILARALETLSECGGRSCRVRSASCRSRASGATARAQTRRRQRLVLNFLNSGMNAVE